MPILENDTPLSLSFNFNRIFVGGYPSTLDVRIENCGSSPVENVILRIECNGFKKCAETKFKRILPSQKLTRILEVDPERSGNFVMRCYLEAAASGQRSQWVGHRQITINVPPPDPSSISISIGNIKTNQGDNAGLGEEGDVNISNLLDLGKLRTLNDLINFKLEDSFGPLSLELDGELTIPGTTWQPEATSQRERKSWQIPNVFCGFVQSASKLILDPLDGSVANGGALRAIHLVAGKEFKIGRTRAAVDFLSWFWPRTPEDDQRTRRISQNVHLRAVLQGDRILFFDGKTTNGSCFDGQRISDEVGYEINQRGTLTLADEYEIDVTPFETGLSEPLSLQNERLWPGPALATAPLRTGSVRFEPVNTEPSLHDALWIFSDATFGSSHLNPLPLKLPGVGETLGRFHHYRSQFWIESFAEAGEVWVNGYKLLSKDLVPLTDGQRVKIGATEFGVSTTA